MGKPTNGKRGKLIRLEVNGVRVRLEIPPEDGDRTALPESMLLFSHTETRVVRLLLAEAALSRERTASIASLYRPMYSTIASNPDIVPGLHEC